MFNHTISPHCTFLCYSTNISTQIAAHPWAFLWSITDVPEPADCTGNLHAALEESQPTNTICQSRPGCCITLLWGLLGGYSKTVPCHVKKGVGECTERENFISHYMIAAWWHLNFQIGCIHPMQSGSDSGLNMITKKKKKPHLILSDVWIWDINYKWQKS